MLEIIQPWQTKVLVLAIHETIQLRHTELLVLDNNAWNHSTKANESMSVSNPWKYTTEANRTISVR